MALCWMDGEFMPAEQARINVMDHGLLYGDGVFEGLRFYGGTVFRSQDHLQRLFDSARAIALNIPYSLQELNRAIESLISQSLLSEGYIRLIVTRGVGPLGLDPGQCKKATVFMVLDELSLVSQTVRQSGLSLIVSSVRRIPNDSIDSRVKSLNYLNQILARLEATSAGADEAVLLNQQGFVAEASTENVFIVKDRCLLTPPSSDGALAGITRQVLLDLAQDQLCTREQSLTSYDLYTADECFLSGTGAELLPVRQVDGRALGQCPGPVFQMLQNKYHELVYGAQLREA